MCVISNGVNDRCKAQRVTVVWISLKEINIFFEHLILNLFKRPVLRSISYPKSLK